MTGLVAVAPGVDRWVMPEAAMNAVVVADGGEALVVDPGTLPSRATALRTAVEARGDRVVGVVVTHAHWDHFFALEAFADVPCYAHPTAVEEIREQAESQRAEVLGFAGPETVEQLRALTITAPGVGVAAPLTLRVGALEVLLEPIGRAHTGGDLVVHVPAAGVTVAGDLVETADDPQLGDSGDASGWLGALDRLARSGQPLLVPGHGDPCGHERLDHHRALLAALAG